MNEPSVDSPDLPERLRIGRSKTLRGVVLSVAGEIDVETAPQLESYVKEFDEHGQIHYVIDLRDVTFVDSSGLAMLLRAQRSADSNGHTLAFRRDSGQLARLLDLTGLRDTLTFE